MRQNKRVTVKLRRRRRRTVVHRNIELQRSTFQVKYSSTSSSFPEFFTPDRHVVEPNSAIVVAHRDSRLDAALVGGGQVERCQQDRVVDGPSQGLINAPNTLERRAMVGRRCMVGDVDVRLLSTCRNQDVVRSNG